MKRFTFIISVILICSVLSGCTGVKIVKKPQFNRVKYNTVAVMDFDGNDTGKGKALAEAFVPVLMESGFSVIERSRLDEIIREQKLAMTGIVDNRDLYEACKIAGVKALVFGNFHIQKRESRVTSTTSDIRHKTRQTFSNTTTESFFDSVSIRLIDINTAEILFSASNTQEIDEQDIDSFFEKAAESFRNGK